MKSLLPLLLAIIATNASSQVVINDVPSNTAAQQAVMPNGYPTVRHTNELRAIPANAPIMPANAAAARRQIPVKNISLNQNGAAHLSGSVRGLGMDTYHFSGEAGDRIDIISEKGKAMEYAIFRPDMGMRFGQHQILPQSGEYELRIVNNRKNAAHNKTPRYYAVTFRLTRANGATAPVVSAPAPVAQQAVAPAPMPVNTVSSQYNIHYICGSGDPLDASFQGNQVMLRQGSNHATLTLKPSASTPTVSVYTNGRLTLTTTQQNAQNQDKPDIQQLTLGKRKHLIVSNCIAQ